MMSSSTASAHVDFTALRLRTQVPEWIEHQEASLWTVLRHHSHRVPGAQDSSKSISHSKSVILQSP